MVNWSGVTLPGAAKFENDWPAHHLKHPGSCTANEGQSTVDLATQLLLTNATHTLLDPDLGADWGNFNTDSITRYWDIIYLCGYTEELYSSYTH